MILLWVLLNYFPQNSSANLVPIPRPKKPVWTLVVRSNSGIEVWKDEKSGFYWSDVLPEMMNHYDALSACESDFSLEARGNLTKLKWSLPSKEEYGISVENEMLEHLKNMERRYFWTSTLKPTFDSIADYMLGLNGQIFSSHRSNKHVSVRCIGKVIKLK